MKKLIIPVLVLLYFSDVQAQKINKIISEKKVRKIETTLSSDAMGGRGLFSPGLDMAADFIAAAFKSAGLQPVNDNGSYFQEFEVMEAKQTGAIGNINGKNIDEQNICALTTDEELAVDVASGYEQATIKAGDRLLNNAYRYMTSDKNYIVWVDTAHAKNFNSLSRLKGERFKSSSSVILVLTAEPVTDFSFTIHNTITEKKLKNVVGILPGKSKKDEYVIFSGHYDHLGIGKPNADGDSIYNGANDDAAGTTAVIMLSKYFSKLKNNERTIVFAAFTAEESGGFGAQYFSKQFEPAKVMAMFNIEMIGTESKWGRNSAYITGYEKTDMGKILEKNLQGTGFIFHPDPYPDQQLFYRSDNATLARLGVPAHTISTSKMDSEPFYHTLDDEVETLDIKNMAEIIKAIALSSKTIISGEDTPSRVDASQLR
ncbi:MAG: M20/M25/M40 family metallo-hydrolase [Agriterribacter sp.]